MDKSYVTLGICPICHKETGELIMDRRLRPTFEMHTIIPYSVCDNCKRTYLKMGVMIINPKTGRLLVLKNTAFKRLFNRVIPANKIVYAEDELIDKLDTMGKTAH